MAIDYLAETQSFRHQKLSAHVATSGALPDAIQDLNDYLDTKGAADWDLVSMERLESSSDKYSFLFVFKK